MADTDFEWTERAIAQLRAHWASGMSTAAIGRQMKISKNSVAKKAHRLGLSRPHPIVRREGAAPRPVKLKRLKEGAKTLPPVLNETAAPVREVYKPPRALSVKLCCWPIGDPCKPSFHFCSDKAVEGRPYCQPHCDVAYVKPSKHWQDDAA